MPVDIRNYGPTWRGFSDFIRFTRARGRCECLGQCGLHQPNPTTRRCSEEHGKPAHWARGLIILNTAHMCNCSPPCTNPAHVFAACQRCHLRYDAFKHAATRAARAKTPAKVHI